MSDERPRREGYAHFLEVPTRWNDNDVYGHVNNVHYYAYFDTVINHWLITEGGLDIHDGGCVGLCVESHCAYHAPIAFPERVEAGLRVDRLGASSARYAVGIFKATEQEAAAHGWFVHVFVDTATGQPTEMPAPIRECLLELSTEEKR